MNYMSQQKALRHGLCDLSILVVPKDTCRLFEISLELEW